MIATDSTHHIAIPSVTPTKIMSHIKSRRHYGRPRRPVTMRTLLVVLSLATVAFAAKFSKPQWKDCAANDPNRAIKIISAEINPGVVKVPGDLVGSFEADVSRDLDGQNTELDVDIYKHRRLLKPAKVPCLFNVGSCTYNPCEITAVKKWKTDGCPVELTNNNIPCTCQFPKSHLKMAKQQFKIPNLKWYLDWLAKGDFNVKATLRDKKTREVLGCFEVSFSVETS